MGKGAEDPHRFRRYHTSSGSRSNYTESPADSIRTPKTKAGPQEKPEEYLLVDGYNIIFAWPELRELATDQFRQRQGQTDGYICATIRDIRDVG